ncbi:MAG: saccharopine dehydrogenase NADP-binding domain-containing protein, partial [Paracoccaceae bacterium]|nr:saccharopine dehydrogenase NADP-binding domain-containing protein [Paracoccaceae bacterium]
MTQTPFRVVVCGAGRMGVCIAQTLAADPRFAVTLAAQDAESLRAPAAQGLDTAALTGPFREALGRLLAGADAVILADSTAIAAEVAALAVARGCHYLDIVESPASALAVADVAASVGLSGAGLSGVGPLGGDAACLAPACGLAPGYVTALAGAMLDRAGPKAAITVHVGVLPAIRVNRLGYGDIWGIDGLLSEYTAPCLAIRGGALCE